MTLLPWQKTVIADKSRFKVVCAGRRAGKSVMVRMWELSLAVKDPGIYWIISPTYKQSKQNHWRDPSGGGLTVEIPREWIDKVNETDLSITLKNSSVIQLKGAEDPDSLRGVRLKALVIDEIASIRNWDWLWNEVLQATLIDFQAPAIFISTPKGFNHFYKLYLCEDADGNKLPDFKSWKFISYDNPTLAPGELDLKKKTTTPDYFAQEYMADFRKYTGLVYKDFARETHITDPFAIPDNWQIYRGIDFGSTNPTACLFIAVDSDDNWFVVAEHYATGETIDFHAGVINANPLSKRVGATYGDPSGAQWISEFAQRGIYITPANKEVGTAFNTWVRYGIEKVSEKLKTVPGKVTNIQRSGVAGKGNNQNGEPALYVFSNCTNLIHEFETYRWKEKSVSQAQDLNEPDVPEKANDHALDALRYFAVSYQKPVDTTELPDDTKKFASRWF